MKVFWLTVFACAWLICQVTGNQMTVPALAETEVDMALVTTTTAEKAEPESAPVLSPKRLIYPKELVGIVPDTAYRETLIQCVNDAGREYGVDPWLIWSVVKYESTYRHFDTKSEKVKRGSSREVGVAQIMLYWSKKWGYNLFDVRDNIRCCAHLLRHARDVEGLTATEDILTWYNTGKKLKSANDYGERGHKQYHTWLALGG